MKKTTHSIMYACIALFLVGCGDPIDDWISDTQSIWVYANEDGTPLDVYVDGDKAVSIPDDMGYLILNAGDYHLTAKSGETVIDETDISLGSEEEGVLEIFIYNHSKKSYALVDCAGYYYDNKETKAIATYFNEGFIHVETDHGSKFYSYDSPLPFQIMDGQTVLKLLEIPADLEGDDAAIQSYCVTTIDSYE